MGILIQMNEVHLGHSQDIRRKSLTYLKKELEIDYHEIPIETLYNRLGSHPIQVIIIIALPNSAVRKKE